MERALIKEEGVIKPSSRHALAVRVLMLCAALLCVASPVYAATATTVQMLQDNDKLALTAWLEPTENIIATQQVNLNIEVATHRWFVGGTQIGRLEVDDAIVLRRDSFAVNSSRRIDGENWAVQLWTITLYPQRGGVFNVPSIPVTVTVSDENNQPVKGEIYTKALTFNALEPADIKDKNGWLATTLFEVEDQFDREISNLNKGDAVKRTISFKAENMAAMMLPALSSEDTGFGNIDGVAVYHKPAVIDDTVNRGEYLAERTETVSYVVEQAGDYRLPALTYYWWDLNSQSMQTAEIPERMLSSSNIVTSDAVERAERSESQGYMFEKSVLLKAMLMAALLVILIMAVRIIARRVKKQRSAGDDTPATLEQKFVAACQQQRYLSAVSILYQWFDHQALVSDGDKMCESMRQWLKGLDDRGVEKQFNQLMAAVYSENPSNKAVKVTTDCEQVSFEQLLKRLQTQAVSRPLLRRLSKPIDLRLN